MQPWVTTNALSSRLNKRTYRLFVTLSLGLNHSQTVVATECGSGRASNLQMSLKPGEKAAHSAFRSCDGAVYLLDQCYKFACRVPVIT